MRFLAVVLSSGILAACGGGSSTDTVDNSITISGTAIKGPMSKAAVNVFKVNADGSKGASLGQAISDASGKYSVNVSGYTGVVIVEAEATSETRMEDEATGQTITPPLGFKMRASFAAESGKTYPTQINPFTEIAVAASAGKVGGFSVTNVAQANKDMAEALRFDPMTKEAEFDSVTKLPKGDLALALAAVSKVAQSDDLAACQPAIGQAAKVQCVVEQMAAKGLDDSTIKTVLQTQSNLIADTIGIVPLVISQPTGTAPSVASPVDQAKAFMATLRSNAKALDASDLSLKTELQKVADDVTGRTAPIAESNINALNVALYAARFWNDVMVTPNATFAQTRNIGSVSNPVGGCGLYSDTNYLTLATSKADAKYVACGTNPKNVWATNANGEFKPCTVVGDLCSTKWSIRVRLHPDAAVANKFTVYTRTRAATYKLQQDGQPAEPVDSNGNKTGRIEYGAAFPGNIATLTTQRDGNGNLTSASLVGEISPAFTIGGGAVYWDSGLQRTVFKENTATVLGDKHNVSLTGALTKVGTLEKLAVAGSIELIKTNALETRIELGDGSYLQATPDANGSYDATNGSQEMLIKLAGKTAASAITGDLKIGAFKLDSSSTSYIPTEISFKGTVQRNDVSFFEGALTAKALNHAAFNSTLPRSNTNPQVMSAEFLGKVMIPTRPTMTVSLSATNTDMGNTSTTQTTGQYSQGLITINLSGSHSAASNVTTLTSTNGLTLVIDESKTIYPLTKGVDTVGSYSTVTKILTYGDGVFEQF